MKKNWKKLPLRLASVNTKELCIGVILIVISFFMPLFFNVHNFAVLRSIRRALRMAEKTDLLAAAIQLVALNSIRGIPHYVGSFFIGESVEFRWKERKVWLLNVPLIMVIVLLTYRGIGTIHQIHYDFGIPAMLVSFFVLLFRKMDYRYVSLVKKASLIILFLTALQFLDVMPAMDRFPVGRGEISMEIKLAAVVLDGETVLNVAALAGMLLFLAFTLVIFFQLRDENNLRQLSSLKEQNQAILVQSQLNEMKNRTYQEMQYLVHDLKSPLTAVQTLVGVLKMKCESESRADDLEYLDYIENTVERMSEMISEILYEDQQSPITTQELVGVALAQSSVNDYAAYLHVDNQIPEAVICANRFLFPRVLINLIQNSAQAMPQDRTPEIWLRVERMEHGDGILFTVEDNGTGIGKEQMKTIWDRGSSGRQSSGLGLAFVQNVIDRMNGKIRMESIPGEGTRISVELPEELAEAEEMC